ncbi:ketopantoate reductase family protein [Nannocystaceae bacterium ST9]
MTTSAISTVVMGAGAVGSYYGALLARAGQSIALIARGRQLDALRARGVTIEREGHPTQVVRPALVTDDPAAIGPVELVVLATKSQDLEAAAATIAPLLGPDTLVLPLLNGVDIHERLAARIGRERIVTGFCEIAVALREPGVVRYNGARDRIVLGELDGRTSERSERLAERLRQAGIHVDVSTRITRDLWTKFLWLDPIAGLCAVTRLPLGPVLAHPETRAQLIACMREVERVALALGVELPANIVETSLARLDGFPAQLRPSLLDSLERGASLEIDGLQGAVIRLGERVGVETPIHRLIHAVLAPAAGGAG